MASSHWIPVCRCCGVRDMLACTRSNDSEFQPMARPEFVSTSISSVCSESPTRRHQIEWVRYK